MTNDDDKREDTSETDSGDAISRRDFSVLSLAAGLAATAGAAHAAAVQVVETAVDVRTPDGVADSYHYHPQGAGTWPGVIIYPDALALRPAFRDMGRRLAGSGYSVLVVNHFYRSGRSPVMPATFDFANPADMALLGRLRAPLTNDAVTRDAIAYLDFLQAQPATNRNAKMGSQGYCMTGPFTIITAAAAPERVGAGASFHGGGLVGMDANSPHLLIPKSRARHLIAIAANDDERAPKDKDTLRAAFAAAGRPAEVEVYAGAMHGWCVKDMPGMIYNEALAERAWTRLLATYKEALV